MVEKVSVIVCLCAWTAIWNIPVCSQPHGNNTTTVPTIVTILTEVPESQSATAKVNLSYNEISELPDYVFFNKNYAQTESIDIFQNKIGDIGAYAFWGLEELKVIDLSDNLIISLEEQTFDTNRKLHRVVLMNNRISFERDKRFLVSESIETLVLSNNRITEVFDRTFRGLPNLRRLLLTDNTLSVLGQHSFQTTTNLRYLSLANTGVYHLTEGMFTKLPHTIALEGTPISQNFEPSLTQVRGHAVKHLLQINSISKNLTSSHHDKAETTDDDFD